VCVRSWTGYVLIFANCPLLWISKLQTEIAVSTMKAEYIALSQSMCDLLPMQYFIMEILTYSTIFEDNNSALVLASSPKMMPRSKHIAIKYHFFREVI